jgi:hypothetical protein
VSQVKRCRKYIKETEAHASIVFFATAKERIILRLGHKKCHNCATNKSLKQDITNTLNTNP